MFDKIILHVGLHKTGTTSLQNYFGKNRDKLKLQGISYPKLKVKEFTPNNHSWPIRNLIMSHPHKYHLNIANNILKNDLKEVINSIDKQFVKLGSTVESTLLLSGEGISTLKTKELSRLNEKLQCISTEKATIEVHYFTRNPTDYVSSVIQQRLKGGTTEGIILSGLSKVSPLRRFMNHGAFERAFNDVTIIEHCYEDACTFPGGLEAYFAKAILNIDTSEFEPNISRDNSGLSDLSFQLIKYYLTHSQEYVRVPIEGTAYKRNIKALSQVKGGKFIITAEQKLKLLSLVNTKKISDDWTVF
ncbi:hypothetical protein [Psychromonas sp. KJ10-2]|uniref:hypothetical protein n=1 Tax=Psychromonas sp. KJ10-2 TaxID=3391822 RepID=UPI0039B421A9